jgi:predicted ATP-dependent Lon-type protease
MMSFAQTGAIAAVADYEAPALNATVLLALEVSDAEVVAELKKHTEGNLGGSIEMIPNAIAIAELAIDKQAQTLLMPVAARRQLNDLPDDLWTRISIEFYKDASDAVFKALVE